MPSTQALSQIVCRDRTKMLNAPANPRTLVELDIPHVFRVHQKR
uniref:Uncharacterized protein n=1 Tax=Acrobeloides nanus TaxID=290746 RepID=A0A914DJ42_9BILA